jgi:hypothetical protein
MQAVTLKTESERSYDRARGVVREREEKLGESERSYERARE